jgi:hypothetical protein
LNLKALEKLSGLKGLEKSLETNYKSGLTGDQQNIKDRQSKYGKNEVCRAILPLKSLLTPCFLVSRARGSNMATIIS